MMDNSKSYFFDGVTYEPERDRVRLTHQLLKVYLVMRDGQWRTLKGINHVVTGAETAISARLRDLRKKRFGGHEVQRRLARNSHNGMYEYRLIIK